MSVITISVPCKISNFSINSPSLLCGSSPPQPEIFHLKIVDYLLNYSSMLKPHNITLLHSSLQKARNQRTTNRATRLKAHQYPSNSLLRLPQRSNPPTPPFVVCVHPSSLTLLTPLPGPQSPNPAPPELAGYFPCGISFTASCCHVNNGGRKLGICCCRRD